MTSGIRAATLLAGVGGAGLLLVTPQAARAQAGIIPLRLKIGVLTPQDRTARDRVGTPLFLGEADLRIPSAGTGAQTYVSIGYQERRAHGNDLRIVPLTVSRLYSPSNPAGAITGNLYYGLGTGIYLMRGRAGGSTKDVTAPGGFAVVGYQTPSTFFVEAKYQLVTSKVNGMRPNGILFMVGKHL